MQTTLAFDVYGTLIDTHGVLSALKVLVGDKAKAFSDTWRDKQLEYSFRKGLMQNYANFAICTRQALDYTCAYYQSNLNDEQKTELMSIYRVLPAFNDVKKGLTQLQTAGFQLFAFSNGAANALEALLNNADIRDLFLDVVSADEIKTFKPNPEIYHHFLKRSASTGANTWLISSNPFDIIGSMSAGMKAAWVKRSPDALFDPWGIEPTITVQSLIELPEEIPNHNSDL
ncbi:2-haloacid dehalogenase [Desulfuromusa kysingii]|uniref:2-haloacid dehalogenase n=1 Tax=Desulfuromusa kysingii TaxID=37625 RepID=A0A1H3W9W9_9BACT|nr:haloacid dehalogenase type II [Desulfuromusa kysingii]SDZ83214.1 2-haloacid dehalogenase [Desulfuromusa kysingii]